MLDGIAIEDIATVIARHEKRSGMDDTFDCSCGFESDDQEFRISFERHVAESISEEVPLFRSLRSQSKDVLVPDADGSMTSALAVSYSTPFTVVAPARLVRRA